MRNYVRSSSCWIYLDWMFRMKRMRGQPTKTNEALTHIHICNSCDHHKNLSPVAILSLTTRVILLMAQRGALNTSEIASYIHIAL